MKQILSWIPFLLIILIKFEFHKHTRCSYYVYAVIQVPIILNQ